MSEFLSEYFILDQKIRHFCYWNGNFIIIPKHHKIKIKIKVFIKLVFFVFLKGC